MDLKKPLTFDEQLDKLIAHGMVISDREEAKDILKKVNYYRFTGYALQFRKDPSGSDYIEGTTFETVYHLYKVDEILRDTFRRYIEKAEVYYRTQIAYGFSIAKCTDAPYDQHYDEHNFYNKKGYKEVMETFGREQNYYKDSLIVKHHKTKYSSKMPLWVIVELMSFSNMSKLYSSMYYSEKNAIAGMVGVSKDTCTTIFHLYKDERFRNGEVNFAMSDVDLTSIIWLSTFGKNSDLPKLKLLEHAYSACAPSRIVINEFLTKVHSLEESEKISQDMAIMLRTQYATLNDLSEISHNKEGVITDEVIYEMVRRVKNRAEKDAKIQLKKEISELQKKERKLKKIGMQLRKEEMS